MRWVHVQIAYTLRLSARPLEDEEVRVHIRGSTDGGYSVKPDTLHFTADNWQREQTVVLKVEQDDVAPAEVGFQAPFRRRGSAISSSRVFRDAIYCKAANCTLLALPFPNLPNNCRAKGLRGESS